MKQVLRFLVGMVLTIVFCTWLHYTLVEATEECVSLEETVQNSTNFQYTVTIEYDEDRVTDHVEQPIYGQAEWVMPTWLIFHDNLDCQPKQEVAQVKSNQDVLRQRVRSLVADFTEDFFNR